MMKKLTSVFVFLLFSFLFVGCEETETTEIHEKAPEWWAYTTNPDNYRNMTLIATLPSGMVADCKPEDRMAVFAGDELVGVGSPLEENKAVYYILIGAPQGGNANLKVMYYSEAKHHIYTTDVIGHFEADVMLGSGTEPLILQFK